jgi:hypothetical protein
MTSITMGLEKSEQEMLALEVADEASLASSNLYSTGQAGKVR